MDCWPANARSATCTIPRPEHRAAHLTRPIVTWSVEQVGDGGDAQLDGALAHLAEAKHELRGPGHLGRPEIAHPVQADSPLARGHHHSLFVRGGRQVCDGME